MRHDHHFHSDQEPHVKKKITILIADDHAVVRMGLKTLLGFQRDFAVVGEAVDGAEAVEQALRLRPDIILLDILMPGTGGIEVARRLKQDGTGIKVLVLTSSTSACDLAQVLKAGVDGVLMKSAPNEELIDAIRDVAQGKKVVSLEIRRMAAEWNDDIRPLTDCQRDVLDCVARGLHNEEIAEKLGISPVTVKKHLKLIFNKLGVSTRAEAATKALQRSLLQY